MTKKTDKNDKAANKRVAEKLDAESKKRVAEGTEDAEIAARVPKVEERKLADAGTVQMVDREIGLENPPEEASPDGDVDTGTQAQREIEKTLREPKSVSKSTHDALNLLREAHRLSADTAYTPEIQRLDRLIDEAEEAVKRGVDIEYDHKALKGAVRDLEHGGRLGSVFQSIGGQ